ncbi:MAG: quinolinate synthase NadA, partial [Actinomycetota bacterium]
MTITASVDQAIRGITNGALPGSTCAPELADGPWVADLGLPTYGPGASVGDVIPTGSPRQGALPEQYRTASNADLHARISAAKQMLGERVVVLGHFYQRDEVIRHADYVGDSFQLAKAAGAHPDAEAIVFCGVHFMAETADLLSGAHQSVILPNLAAGCSMADMADADSVAECWEQL